MSLPNPNPSDPAQPNPYFQDNNFVRGTQLRNNNSSIWGNFTALDNRLLPIEKGFANMQMEVITSSGASTILSGKIKAYIIIIGGGGGGGAGYGAGYLSPGGGGGAGCKIEGVYSVTGNISITIGANGLGGTSAGANGTDGGDTIISGGGLAATVTAGGGKKGGGGGTVQALVGAGGSATNPGTNSIVTTKHGPNPLFANPGFGLKMDFPGAAGGDNGSPYGQGGQGGDVQINPSVDGHGYDGTAGAVIIIA